ncbi:ribonuclease HII [Sulfolobales archaeon HS-7]|nr:ribonuclease HII [Sulfolobales archaeon HS-7]
MNLGIDEAGRGCIIGPMIVAGVFIEQEKLRTLKSIGVKDSKKLTKRSRESLYRLIFEIVNGVTIVKVEPELIDKYNLNLLTKYSMLKIIETSPYRLSKVVIDKVGNMQDVEETVIRTGAIPIIENKADDKYLEVGAASIVAKVIRDDIIASLKEKYGDFGSGYPSDKKTINWLHAVLTKGPPPIVRRSWKTLQKLSSNYYMTK